MQRTGQDPLHHLLSESRRTMQDGSKEQRGIPCEQPTGTKRIPAFSSVGRAAYVTGRRIRIQNRCVVRFKSGCIFYSNRSGTAENSESVVSLSRKPSSSMDRGICPERRRLFSSGSTSLLHRLPQCLLRHCSSDVG